MVPFLIRTIEHCHYLMTFVSLTLPCLSIHAETVVLLDISTLISLETGWAITAHAVGLGRPMDEQLETTGKAVPGYDGNATFGLLCLRDVAKIGNQWDDVYTCVYVPKT